MPIYEYECPRCQKVHEVMQKFSDAPLETCPDCQGQVKRIMSLSSFALKGSGWYTTDYKRKATTGSNAAQSDAGQSAASEPSKGGATPADTAKAETKPAVATPSPAPAEKKSPTEKS